MIHAAVWIRTTSDHDYTTYQGKLYTGRSPLWDSYLPTNDAIYLSDVLFLLSIKSVYHFFFFGVLIHPYFHEFLFPYFHSSCLFNCLLMYILIFLSFYLYIWQPIPLSTCSYLSTYLSGYEWIYLWNQLIVLSYHLLWGNTTSIIAFYCWQSADIWISQHSFYSKIQKDINVRYDTVYITTLSHHSDEFLMCIISYK